MKTDRKILLAPSLLSADFAKLGDEVKKCETGGCDILHADIMDGHFVPNITFGPLVVKAIKPHSNLPIDCHLMIENPNKYIEAFAKAGADYISVHAEGLAHAHRSLSLIKECGAKAGLALNPITPIEFAFEAAEYCDFILLMSVNPGFGGQKFINSFLRRAEALREFLIKNGLEHVVIEVDGGVKIDNVEQIVRAGADMIVSGSGLFRGDFNANAKQMRANAEKGLI
ncbi:MAG: ribulose-phosphate 3-epimerase [Chlorobi bacterium]|nr:ribulose-phosphate 3-epimerase [Chlorobiota bacterium]